MKNPKSDMHFDQAASVASAIATLLAPHAEVVLHDLTDGRIAGIWNRFSDRDVGDESLLEETTEAFKGPHQALGPYQKRETDGRLIRSVTTVLRSPDGRRAIGLLCINLDVSMLEGAAQAMSAFLSVDAARPEALFSKDWREQINLLAHEWLASNNRSMNSLSRREKISLVRYLDEKGLFETRGAVNHVARLTGVSRATTYNYIAAARTSDTGAQAR